MQNENLLKYVCACVCDIKKSISSNRKSYRIILPMNNKIFKRKTLIYYQETKWALRMRMMSCGFERENCLKRTTINLFWLFKFHFISLLLDWCVVLLLEFITMHYWRVHKENKHSIGNKSSFLSCFRGNYSMYYTRSQDKAILILFMIREKLLSLLFIFNFFFTSFFLSLALHHHIYQVLIKHLISPQIWYLFLF